MVLSLKHLVKEIYHLKHVPGIKALLTKEIPVVLVSRCFNGIVQDIYGYEGGGRQLKELGVIFQMD